MSSDLERRYRRVLRLLPGWYRAQWEQDMVAAFLDSWLTGDPEEDKAIIEFCKPGWAEVASVAGLAVRLHLGGPGTARRHAFVTLALGHYRTARVLAALAIVPGLVALLQAQLTGILPAPFGPWIFWVLVDLAPVLAMTAFHRDAQPAAPGPWLLALPAGYVLVYGPLRALQATGNFAWLPDFPGLCCILVALGCLAHAPRAWSRQSAGSGVWSLTLALLAAVAGAYRIVTLTDYLHDPHLISVSLAELLIVVAAVALVAPDAARALAAAPAPPPHPRAMAT